MPSSLPPGKVPPELLRRHALGRGAARSDVLVGPEDECVVTSAIEAPRMRAEQAVGFEVVEHPWYGDRDAPVRERSAGCDVDGVVTLPAADGPELLVCTAGGVSGLRAGDAAVLEPGEAVELSGQGVIWRCRAPLFSAS